MCDDIGERERKRKRLRVTEQYNFRSHDIRKED